MIETCEIRSQQARRLDALERDLRGIALAHAALRPPRRTTPRLAHLAVLVLGTTLLIGAAPGGTRVRTPFVVVGDDNRPLLTVTDVGSYGLSLHDLGGKPLVTAGVTRGNGVIRVQAPPPAAARGGSGRTRNTTTEVAFGVVGETTPVVNFKSADKSRVSFAVVDDKPDVTMGNESVNVTQATGGGGLLQLGGPDGSERVAFLVNGNGIGIVRAQPVGNVGVNVPVTGILRGTGLPSTMICGIGCAR